MAAKLAYRADIDGLRAIAVLAVIANHLPGHFLPGGFLGVDVFFVISGFVVTGSIASRKLNGFYAFYTDFLHRRVKRLLPALVTCVLLTCVAVELIDPFPRESLKTGVYALFGVSNIYLYFAGLDYFAPSSKFNAFTHTWSLGVEEQFYLLFPLVFWAFSRSAGYRGLSFVLALLSLASVLAFVWLYAVNQGAAYFLSPLRFWELGAGALAYLHAERMADSQLARRLPGLRTVLFLLLLCCFCLSRDFASGTTVLAVATTAGLLPLLACTRSPVVRILSQPPVVYLGRISYSLYLYHWPVIVLAPLALPPAWVSPFTLVVGMLALSVMSYHLLEQPFRRMSSAGHPLRVLASGATASITLALTVLMLIHADEPSLIVEQAGRYPGAESYVPGTELVFTRTCRVDEKHAYSVEKFERCTTAPAPGSRLPTIWLQGDSHAGRLYNLLVQLHQEMGVGIHATVSPGLPFPISHNRTQVAGRYAVHAEIVDRAHSGDIVMLGRNYFRRRSRLIAQPAIDTWAEKVSALATELEGRGLNLVVVGPLPMFFFEDVRECDLKAGNCDVDRLQQAQEVQQILTVLEAALAENRNAFVFDIFPVLCPGGPVCSPAQDGVFNFSDRDHINTLGARRASEPFVTFMRENGLLASIHARPED